MLSKTLDSTALTHDKVELATVVHDPEADVVSGLTADIARVLARGARTSAKEGGGCRCCTTCTTRPS